MHNKGQSAASSDCARARILIDRDEKIDRDENVNSILDERQQDMIFEPMPTELKRGSR
jgi:hypothetical protein